MKPVPTLHPWPVRIMRHLRYPVARAGRERLVARAAPFNLVFTGPSNDCVTRHIYQAGSHEPQITRYVLDTIRIEPCEVAIDVCANLGWYSVLFDRLAAAHSRIFAFEPDRPTYGLLLKNLLANRASRVTPVNAAPGNAIHTGSDLHKVLAGDDGLKRFWDGHGLAGRRIRILRLDTAGYEYFVLDGADALLKQCDCILLKYSPADLLDDELDLRSMTMDLLRRFGFAARAFSDGQLLPVRFEQLVNTQETMDLLLTVSLDH